VAVKILNPSHCFAGMLPSERFLVETALSIAFEEPRLLGVCDNSWSSYLWLIGRTRLERNILVQWRLVMNPQPAFVFLLPHMQTALQVPISEFREVWQKEGLGAFMHYSRPLLREVEDYYGPRDHLFIQLLKPCGEEFAWVLAWAFRVGWPLVRDVIGIPPPYIPRPEREFALRLIHDMRIYAAKQGNWKPASDYLFGISEEFSVWIAHIRRWLLYLYGIIPDKYLWIPHETSQAPLKLVLPPEIVTEKVTLITGVHYPTPREILLEWAKEVMSYG